MTTESRPVTISVGAAWRPPDHQDADLLDVLPQQADHLMYEAKRSGRHRAVLPQDRVA